MRARNPKQWRSRRRSRTPGTDGGVDRPPEPPLCPEGWQTAPPDFVGVGVQRSGTSRWFALISVHPQVATPNAMKELHYFDRFYSGGFGEAERSGYASYFPRPSDQVAGEWTPMYASAPWIPPLLAAAAPHARILVLLRDPVERWRSGMALDAKVAARRGAPLSRYAPLEAFVRGLYHAQLSRLLEHFPSERLLVLQYERCAHAPRSQLTRTYEFLGLDPAFEPGLEAHPRKQLDKPQLDEGARASYVAAYREDVLALAGAFPGIDLSLWPNFAHLA